MDGLYVRAAMEFYNLQSVLRRHRNAVVFAALVSIVAGLDLLLNPPEPGRVEILSLPFIVGAALLLAIVFWPEIQKATPETIEETLGHRFLHRVTLEGKLIPFLPLVGLAIIGLDVAYNAFISPAPTLMIHDSVAIMFGLSLVVYPFIPQRFDRERDFVVLFFFCLVAILVAPLLIMQVIRGNLDNAVNVYSSTMLAPELQALLRVFGIPASLMTDPSSGAPGLEFLTQTRQPITVVISTACSGIYSFSIFASAFTAFILTEFKRVDKRVWSLLILGFVASYFANLLRMAIIVATGYFSDTTQGALNSMLIAHSNAGWLIFLGWISLFWLLMYRFLFPRTVPDMPAVKKEARCALCAEPLSPTIPGTMCQCGTMYHMTCAQEKKACPKCNRTFMWHEAQVEPQT